MQEKKNHHFNKKRECIFTIIDSRQQTKKLVKFSFLSCKNCGLKDTKYEVLDESELGVELMIH